MIRNLINEIRRRQKKPFFVNPHPPDFEPVRARARGMAFMCQNEIEHKTT